MTCKKCGGLGYLETPTGNKLCICKVSENIKTVLNKYPELLMSAGNTKINKELFPENCVLSVNDSSKGFTVLKTMFTYFYVKKRVTDLEFVDADTLMEAYFDKSEYYSISSLKEMDYLVLSLEDKKNNKLLPDVIDSIVTYRKNILGKPTWILYKTNTPSGKIEGNTLFAPLCTKLDSQLGFTFRKVK